MFNLKHEHGKYNLWKQTGLAFIPLVVALIAFPMLPNRVYVPTAMASLSPWGVRGNVFIYPVFCLILWLLAWAFIFFNRLYEKNLKITRQSYRPLETYYIWGSWIIDLAATVMVLIQVAVTLTH